MNFDEVVERLKTVSDTPRQEARLLMRYASDNLEKALERRLRHEPIAKIIGRRGFWKTEFKVTGDVLDPRADSEAVIEALCDVFPDKEKKMRILDIGVGSGCLLYSALDEYPNAVGVGIDTSPAALQVAAENRENRSAVLYQRNFTDENWTAELGVFDVVLTNPPYIPTKEIDGLMPEVRMYDPAIALDGGADGLDAYRALAAVGKNLLVPGGYFMTEIGQGQEADVRHLFCNNGFNYIKSRRDYGGIIRVLIFQTRLECHT